jgi:hypothetical protein
MVVYIGWSPLESMCYVIEDLWLRSRRLFHSNKWWSSNYRNAQYLSDTGVTIETLELDLSPRV